MTRSDEPLFEPRIADWLEDDPNTAPDQALDIVLAAFPSIKQRRAGRVPWRVPGMTTPLRLGLTAAAVGALAIGSLLVVNRGPSGPGGPGGPTPSTTPASPSPSPSTSLLDPSPWTTYTSSRYGFSIAHPADWTEVPADHDWALPADADWLNTAAESFKAPGEAVRVSAWSVSIHPAELLDRPTLTWIANAYCPLNTTPCDRLESRTVAVTMDGHPGSLVQFADDTQAFILVDDRMYVVAVWEPDSDPRTAPYGGAQHLLKDILSTMRLLPGGPASAVPSATQS
jgi:hypothetical protein